MANRRIKRAGFGEANKWADEIIDGVVEDVKNGSSVETAVSNQLDAQFYWSEDIWSAAQEYLNDDDVMNLFYDDFLSDVITEVEDKLDDYDIEREGSRKMPRHAKIKSYGNKQKSAKASSNRVNNSRRAFRMASRLKKASLASDWAADIIDSVEYFMSEDGGSHDEYEAVSMALDDELIYYDDQWEVIKTYGNASDFLGQVWEEFENDVVDDVLNMLPEKDASRKASRKRTSAKTSRINSNHKASANKRSSSRRKQSGWRGTDEIEVKSEPGFLGIPSMSDPSLIYNGYEFNYWDIEDALWSDFLEYTGHDDSEANDPVVEEEFNKYVQENATNYLDDYIFSEAPKSWKTSRQAKIVNKATNRR